MKNRTLATLLTLILACAGAAAQDRCPHCGGSLDPAAADADKPLFSIPITQTTVENALDHAVLDMAERYKLDDEQLARTQQVVRDKLLPFVKENGPRVQKLMSRFIEAQTGFEPPDSDMVADWSNELLPILDSFKDTVGGLAGEMGELMTDDQRLQLEAEMGAFRVGIGMVQRKLGGWADGNFDPEIDWPGDSRERRRREREERIAREKAMDEARQRVLAAGGTGEGGAPGASTAANGDGTASAAPKGAIASVGKDEWTIYVDRFIQRYGLNEEQRLQAQRELEKRRGTRDAYLTRGDTLREMETVKQLIAGATAEEEKAAAQKRLDRLEDPVKRMFQQLKEGLARIPTRDQRKRAAESDGDEIGIAGESGAKVAQKKEGPGSP